MKKSKEYVNLIFGKEALEFQDLLTFVKRIQTETMTEVIKQVEKHNTSGDVVYDEFSGLVAYPFLVEVEENISKTFIS